MKDNINWKKELQAAFSAPEPKEKDQFIRKLHFPKLSYSDFLFSQLFYIRKRVWAAAALFTFLGMGVSFLSPEGLQYTDTLNNCWIIAALLPFIMLFSVTEILRSGNFGMAELEAGCRFSLQQVVTARILLLGGMNGALLLTLLLLFKRISVFGFGRMTVYFLLPYLLAGAVCLLLLNRIRGTEGIYACAGAACGVCLFYSSIHLLAESIYITRYFYLWLLLEMLCTGIIITQLNQLIKQSGKEKQWNLYLTD